jgi:glycosyltransferase involved in cell wall biosynthesis
MRRLDFHNGGPRNFASPGTLARAATPHSGIVLFLGNVPFQSCWQRAQQLAIGVARTEPVVYVDPNRSFLQSWLPRAKTIEEVPADSRLRVFQPPAGLPLGRSLPACHWLNSRRTCRRLGRFVGAGAGESLRAVVATFPDQWQLVRTLPSNVPLVYDVMDDFTLFLQPWQRPRYDAMHRRMLARARYVTTSSHVLQSRHRSLGYRLDYVGNGARGSLVHRCAEAAPDPALAALPCPRLGYVGMISRWLDVEALWALANAFPRGSVVLIGPRDVPLPRLPSNVHWLGPVRQERLPAILRTFDLGLIPFVPGSAIDAVNPVKLYEYLAAGLPVLASDFAEMRTHADQAALYRYPDEAVALTRRLLAQGPTPSQVRRRQEYALENTWEEKAKQLQELIGRAGAQRKPFPARA